jgi:uncharacterized protein DUF4913
MTAGPGEWGDDEPSRPPSPPPPAPAGAPAARSAIDAALASVDVEAFVQDAVRAAMRKRLEGVAAAAVNDVLTEPLLADLREAAEKAARAAFSAETASEKPELYYPDLLSFVTEYLTPMYRRAVSGTNMTWCAQWWKHAEGIVRLEALWRSWEHLRQDPHTGLSVWLRDHADHHMAILLSAEGPFKGCKLDKHAERVAKLPTADPPDARATLR